ncbi:MAG TPA: RNA methyltransferase [Candidatus Kapabacteria bacterium]|jgi:tRNA G18 (ribose-2'-O)-methylase SpoU|nr:RNA methyltransferase [Candidatus Kapabacteria bacterium]HOM05345.1 RNA methyltransferase [Candidatus Kapabacteria bacterium]HOQ49896.1 RNA methyltransferase [Candidatus Kapabacteria bacterium]HPP39828.1 RNA methyltransferase [Candidatus Kapabacteria bacterium]HPU22845.1 RNA methyltransferase [Candidatus Kapabacteria bacterium]
MNFKYLNSLEFLPAEVDFYRNIRFTPQSHIENNIFLTEGIVSFRKLLESNLKILSVLTTEKYISVIQEFTSRFTDVNIFVAPDKKLIEIIIGFLPNEPIYAIARIPPQFSLDELGNRIVFLDGVSKQENVGSIIRNALAFDIDSLIYSTESCFPYLRRVVRVSLGCVFSMKIAHSANSLETIALLRDLGYSIIAIEQSDKSIDISSSISHQKACFVFGNESKGISKPILDIADEIIEIRTNKKAGSLNVAACSAIVFWKYSNLS